MNEYLKKIKNEFSNQQQIASNNLPINSLLPPKKNAFVLTATDIGPMLVNRFDATSAGQITYGVGYQFLETSIFDASEIQFVCNILKMIRKNKNDTIFALDCGANIGAHSIAWGRMMTTWGNIIAIEAQERIFYALTGNITINNLFNVRAIWSALSNEVGELEIPVPNYLDYASFGSLELQKTLTPDVGQSIDYTKGKGQIVKQMTIDSLNLSRLDFMKIDVEGMEEKVLAGAFNTIQQHKPAIFIEHQKTGKSIITNIMQQHGYKLFDVGENFLCVHESDILLSQIK